MPEPEPEPHSDLAATVPEKHGTGEQTTIEPALIGPKMIAPWWHFVVFFLIVAGTLYSGWAAQQHAAEHPQSSSAALAPSHPGASKAWLGAAAADLLFLLYCWAGVRGQGGSLLALSGGRWTTWQQLAGDIGVALPFWLVWEGVAYGVYWVLGPNQASAVFPLLPRTVAEAGAWVTLSLTAGFCEELIFRGYLQRQLLAISGSVVAAVIGQGLVFGLVHSYQGWKSVTVIAVLGILYGTLAALRGNLRANIMSHAWSDIFEGWLKFLLLPRWFPS